MAPDPFVTAGCRCTHRDEIALQPNAPHPSRFSPKLAQIPESALNPGRIAVLIRAYLRSSVANSQLP
jgi:hypothetical protein